jgi:hypothetical protein
MSAVLYLFLAHLGIGIAFTLLLVSKQAGVKFFRFNSGLAALLIAGALAFRPSPSQAGSAVITPATLVSLGVALGALTVYWLIAGRVLAKLRPILAVLASMAGAATLVLQGIAAAAAGVPGSALTAVSMVASAALLGGACTSMVLGHWYLILPSMEVRHLQKIVGFHIGTLVLRVLVVVAVIAIAWGHPLLSGQTPRRYITSLDGIFFWQRVLFGLAGPAVLGYLTWETAKIRSTQSATGILYVDFFTVVVGEVLASYVLLSTGLAV